MTAYTEPVQTAPTQSQHSAASADPGTVDPNWTPPEDPAKTGAPARIARKPIPAAALFGCILIALALLVGWMWDSVASKSGPTFSKRHRQAP